MKRGFVALFVLTALFLFTACSTEQEAVSYATGSWTPVSSVEPNSSQSKDINNVYHSTLGFQLSHSSFFLYRTSAAGLSMLVPRNAADDRIGLYFDENSPYIAEITEAVMDEKLARHGNVTRTGNFTKFERPKIVIYAKSIVVSEDGKDWYIRDYIFNINGKTCIATAIVPEVSLIQQYDNMIQFIQISNEEESSAGSSEVSVQ